jgi:hypothetical protein
MNCCLPAEVTLRVDKACLKDKLSFCCVLRGSNSTIMLIIIQPLDLELGQKWHEVQLSAANQPSNRVSSSISTFNVLYSIIL